MKSPKVYVGDTGLLHALHDIRTREDLDGHPAAGPSWEWFGIEAVVRRLGARRDQCWFWATHQGAELDLLVADGRRRLGFEFKRTSSPTVTASMRIAMADLRLDSLDVIHGGNATFPMADRIRAVPLSRVLRDVRGLD
ncbi:MAG: hypothetical protein HMLKMBBP_01815 [Planctomycetes bacterium]|nr:hypothetical protein [Planctomycetota bacterium]